MATADGGFLIADTDNQRVRRVSPAGTIATVAGTGTQGFSGDGGPATAAQLVGPEGVAVTANGGFLIADAAKNRVRFVDADPRFLQGPAGPPPLALALARYPAQRASAATDHASLCGDRARSHGGAGVRGRGTLTRARDGARGDASRIRVRAPGRASHYRLRLEPTADGRGASALLIARGASPGRG
jgi:hypothetical protein